jgi:hypothetical protein
MNVEKNVEDHRTRWNDQTITPSFRDSEEAYNRCLWDDAMKEGRIFTVPSERIVGISRDLVAPLVVTAEAGKLHSAETDPRMWDDDPLIAAAVAPAIDLARKNGWALARWAEEEADQ